MENKTCKHCLLHSGMPDVNLDDGGVCNVCKEHKPFKPRPENKLLVLLKAARKKGRPYDALVPLSGGKASAYVL